MTEIITQKITLEDLVAKLSGENMGLSLSKFLKLNLPIYSQFKQLHIPQKTQAEITSKALNKNVSVSSLAVALSRLTPSAEHTNTQVVIMKKPIAERFVQKNVKLTLGSQKETVKTVGKNGKTVEEKIIDWRGLAPNESLSHWVLEYKNRLVAINKTGWRWEQIAQAVSEHLGLTNKLKTNTLTSIISLSNKKIIKNTQTN